jgi:hypothetical protein
VYGEIQAFSHTTSKISVHGSISRSRNGWTWSTNANTRFTYTGAGGYSYGCFSDSEQNVANSKEEAEAFMLEEIIREVNELMKKKYGDEVPAEAVREYTNARKAAEKQLKQLGEQKLIPGTQLSLF